MAIGAAAAAPTALFALGATLAGFRIAGDLAEAAFEGPLLEAIGRHADIPGVIAAALATRAARRAA